MIAARGLAIILIPFAAFTAPLSADIVSYPETGPQVVQSGDTPRRGMNKGQVERSFGAPDIRQAAVGEPPISSWDYGAFTVYFEGDTVLHTVSSNH